MSTGYVDASRIANASTPVPVTALGTGTPTDGYVLTATGVGSAPAWEAPPGGGGNSFGTIAVSGQSNVVADAGADTLTLAAGSNITITTNAGTDTVTIAAAGGGAGQLVVNIHADATANVTMTNQANAEQFLANSNRNITKIDLTNYTEVRLVAHVVTGSASVNSPRIYAEYHTSFTTTVATYSGIGTSVVSCSLTTAGLVDSGWVPLVTGAKADVFVTVLQNGGNAAADPAVAHVSLQFR